MKFLMLMSMLLVVILVESLPTDSKLNNEEDDLNILERLVKTIEYEVQDLKEKQLKRKEFGLQWLLKNRQNGSTIEELPQNDSSVDTAILESSGSFQDSVFTIEPNISFTSVFEDDANLSLSVIVEKEVSVQASILVDGDNSGANSNREGNTDGNVHMVLDIQDNEVGQDKLGQQKVKEKVDVDGSGENEVMKKEETVDGSGEEKNDAVVDGNDVQSFKEVKETGDVGSGENEVIKKEEIVEGSGEENNGIVADDNGVKQTSILKELDPAEEDKIVEDIYKVEMEMLALQKAANELADKMKKVDREIQHDQNIKWPWNKKSKMTKKFKWPWHKS